MLFRSRLFAGLSVRDQKRRLVAALAVFLLALSVPMSLLIHKGYQQFQKDVYHFYFWHSKQVVQSVISDYEMHIKVENNRAIDDYQFFKSSKRKNSGFTLSPLAVVPDQSPVPGLISYFQTDSSGSFSCPLLPFPANSSGTNSPVANILDQQEVAKRIALRKRLEPLLIDTGFMRDVSMDNQVRQPGPGSAMPLRYPADLIYENQAYPTEVKKISTFKSKRSRDGHLIFYREIWNGENKLNQGFAVNERRFLFKTIKSVFSRAEFKSDVLLHINYRGSHIASMLHTAESEDDRNVHFVDSDTPEKDLSIYKFNLREPLEEYSLAFSVDKLPLGDATITGGIFLLIVIGIIITGLLIFYRLGIQQIHLNEERLNFVSSVSHELKTPLTSIIMYADMLRSGMVKEKQKTGEYYDFIFFEGERLGRLIANVLRLSKLGQDSADITLEYTPISTALDLLKSKTSTVIENNGFELKFNFSDEVQEQYSILIDKDSFTQIAINLVDNAVKFTSEHFDRARNGQAPFANINNSIDVNISIDKSQNGRLKMGIRDYGLGIAKADAKHIFKSFYRAGNELTRKTTGTGMGLSLVKELARAMEGDVTFYNRDPGVEFIVYFQYRTESK